MSETLLHAPFEIGPDLRPALRVGNGWISLEYSRRRDPEYRVVYSYWIDVGDGAEPHHTEDLKSGCGGGNLQEGFASLLSFLSACAESWSDDPDDRGENADLFPPHVAAWAKQHSDEISSLCCDIDEIGLIQE